MVGLIADEVLDVLSLPGGQIARPADILPEGLETPHQAGGLTRAQDEQSYVVYGMPHEAIVRNAVDRVLTLE